VLSDLDFGMNQWMTRKFEYPDQPMDRGKVLWEADLEKLGGQWARFVDVDGDGVPYRTLPGNRHPKAAYFSRGTGHNEFARYSEDPHEWEKNINRLRKKIDLARPTLPKPVIEKVDGAQIGLIAYGSTDPAVQEARAGLQAHGIATDYLRVRALPPSEEVLEFVNNHPVTYVIEMNRDGQLAQILSMESPETAPQLRKIAHIDGLPLTARWVMEELLAQEER
jgi:2-oxoglutarate ferredoxin oxidoreductase subunit alpha